MQLQRRRRILPIVPFSSLADMAFILLVFFLLSSHFAESDPPPVRLARTTASLSEQKHTPLRIFLTASGQLGLDGLVLQVDALPSDPGVLEPLRQRLSGRTITLGIDADCPYTLVRRALHLLENAGLEHFSFEMESAR